MSFFSLFFPVSFFVSFLTGIHIFLPGGPHSLQRAAVPKAASMRGPARHRLLHGHSAARLLDISVPGICGRYFRERLLRRHGG
jgi:hypothetical protein